MDAVLRFGHLDGELVQVARDKGWQIHPTTRGRGYNVVISSAPTFSQQILEAERFVRDETSFLAEILTRSVESELDFGLDWDDAHRVENHRFSPELMERLAKLRITLNVSTYRL